MNRINKTCSHCFVSLEGSHHNRKYCSQSCVNKSKYIRNGPKNTPEQRSAWYKERVKNPEYVQKLRNQVNKQSKLVKEFLAEFKKKHGCVDCGYNKHHAALDFDHVRGEKRINVCFAKSIKAAMKEIEKCEVVCANCHRIRTYLRLHACKDDIFQATYMRVEENEEKHYTA